MSVLTFKGVGVKAWLELYTASFSNPQRYRPIRQFRGALTILSKCENKDF